MRQILAKVTGVARGYKYTYITTVTLLTTLLTKSPEPPCRVPLQGSIKAFIRAPVSGLGYRFGFSSLVPSRRLRVYWAKG